jgi:hypothetical protein
MENNLELNSQLVLVRFRLSLDPAERQSTIGIIVSEHASGAYFNIGFQDNTRDLCASDTLFVLKPMDEINQLLFDYGVKLSWTDLKALIQLTVTLRHGIGDRVYSALKLAIKNPAIQPFCLDLLKDRIAVRQVYNRQR